MDEVEYRVSFNGNPPPKVGWIDNRGQMIQWSHEQDEFIKLNAAKEGGTSKLTIPHLDLEDSGNYTFFADNGYERKQQVFRLLVGGK